MRIGRIFIIAVVAFTSCAVVAVVWYITHRPSNADVYLLVTSSIQGGVTPVREGDTRLGGLILMSTALKEEIRQFGRERVVIVDAGNSLFNDTAHAAFAGEIPRLFRAVGYQGVTLGYRDFEILRHLCQKEGFALPVVACNMKLDPQYFKEVTVHPRIDRRVNGLVIAIIGVVDPGIKSEQGVDDLVGVEIDDEEQTLEKVRTEVQRLPDDVDVVVVLSSAVRASVNDRIVEKCPRVDIIASLGAGANGWIAHSGRCSIISAASYGRSIGLVEIHANGNNRGHREFRLRQIRVSSTDFAPDPDIRKVIQQYWLNKLASPEPDRVIGSVANKSGIAYEIEDDLKLEHPAWTYFNRPMYNLVTDAIRYAYPFCKKDVPEVDIALYNTGAIEAGLGPGFVTLSHLQKAIPYNNHVVHVRFTKAQILEMLNSPGMRKHGILCASGLDYTWDYGRGLIEDSVFLVDKNGAQQPLKEDRQYVLVLTDFLASGGDDYLSGPSFKSIVGPFQKRMQGGPLSDYPTTTELLEYYFRECSPVSGPRERAIKFRR